MTELQDVSIQFVSLVDRAANKREFAIVKNADGSNNMSLGCPIIKQDTEKRLVTAVVYTPNEIDTQGDYMTAEEIEKAAHSFMENKPKVDLQHNEKAEESITVVESWVAKEDNKIGKQDIKKGTWLMTAKINSDTIWKDIKKGKYTGFSMGGVGKRVAKSNFNNLNEHSSNKDIEKSFAHKVISAISKAFGMDGETEEESKIRELEERKQELESEKDNIEEELSKLKGKDKNNGGNEDMSKEEVMALIQEALKPLVDKIGAAEQVPVDEKDEKGVTKGEEVSKEEKKEDVLKAEDIKEIIKSAVEPLNTRLDKIETARGISKQADVLPKQSVKKEEDIFNGLIFKSRE